MAEPLHRHGARREGLLQVDEQFCVRKSDRKFREAQRYQTVRNDKQRNYLVSEPNYNTTKCFSENLLAIEMNKIYVKMNKRCV